MINKHYGFVAGAFFAAIMFFSLAVPSTGLAKSTCSGGTVTGTVNGGLTVTSDCSVTGATIHGGINQTGGSLTVCGSEVDGGVNSTGGTAIVVGEVDTGTCAGNQINGHVSISGVGVVELDSDIINGGADLNGNLGLVEVESNHIQGPPNCAGNAGPVTNDGFPNSVTGAETGQCSGL
jgi:hypothetical protein